jgi:hypothetical protein
MDDPRTTAACGSSIGASSGPGRSGSAGGRGEERLPGRSTRSCCTAIRFCDPGSHVLGPEQRVLPEEPIGVIPHGGVCEGRGQPKRHGEPRRARSRKRRIQTRNAYSDLRSSLLLGRSWSTPSRGRAATRPIRPASGPCALFSPCATRSSSRCSLETIGLAAA